jgi:RHS repeat-associated protein
VAAAFGVGAGLDLDGAVAAGGTDELLDRPAGPVFDPAADGEGGEHDGQVGLDRFALTVVDRAGLQVVFGHSERFFNLEQPVVGVDHELRGDRGAVRARGEVGDVPLQPGQGSCLGFEDAEYNALGELDHVDRYTGSGGHVYTSYTRELETGRLTGIRTDRDSVTPNTLADTSYQYDPAGNITKIVDAAPDPADDTQCFTYDQLRRLTEAWTPANGDCATAPSTALLGGPAAYWNSWQYDAVGNRTQETVHAASGDTSTGYTYPEPGSTTVRPHAVTGTTGARTGSYTYDATGNVLTRPTPSAGTQTMTWDAEGPPGNLHRRQRADQLHLRRRRQPAHPPRPHRPHPLPARPGDPLYRRHGTTSCTRYYTFAGATIGSRTSTALTWLSTDHQGTALVAVDAATQQATARRQTPFGTPRGASAAWANDKGFVGGTNDNTGLTHLGAREYDPRLGKFISVDPFRTSPTRSSGTATPATVRSPRPTPPDCATPMPALDTSLASTTVVSPPRAAGATAATTAARARSPMSTRAAPRSR